MWGRVGGIVNVKCGAGLVEFTGDMWGIVGGIVKTICVAELVEL